MLDIAAIFSSVLSSLKTVANIVYKFTKDSDVLLEKAELVRLLADAELQIADIQSFLS